MSWRGSFLSRLLALTLLLAPLCAAFWWISVPLWERWRAQGAEIVNLRAGAARMDAHEAAAAAIERSAAEWRAFAADPRAGFANAPLDLAAQDGLDRIGGLIEDYGGEVSLGESLETTAAAGYDTARIALRATLPSAQIAQFAAALEMQTPFMIIDRFEIEAPETRAGEESPPLAVIVEARIYRLTEARP